MDFILSYNNNERVMTFPVVPNGGVELERKQSNVAFQGIRDELQAIGTMDLATFSLSSFFPNKPYPWIRPGAVADGWSYVRTIEAARRRRIPFRAIYLGQDGAEIFNLPVTVESFVYWLDQAGDVSYSIDFREYRFAELTAVQEGLAHQESATGQQTTVQTEAQQQANSGTSAGGTFQRRYSKNEAVMLAKTMWGEARGVKSKTELACLGWVACNRVDAGNRKLYGGTIAEVLTKPQQMYYKPSFRTVSDYGYDLVALATDVLDRWSREKAGQKNVMRVLPRGYLWYSGDGKHNYYRNKYQGGKRWDYSLPSPYDS